MQKQVGVALVRGRMRSASVKTFGRKVSGDRAAHLLWSAWRNQEAVALSATVQRAAEAPHRAPSPLAIDDPSPRWPAETGWRLLCRFLAEFAQTPSTPNASRGNPIATVDRSSGPRPLPHIEYRLLPGNSGARCALLKSGGLRIYAPEPTGVHTFLLLAHEYAHALLALQVPGSLSDFVQTESHALALERCAGRWLARQPAPCQGARLGEIHGDLKQWWRGRRHVWTVYHQRLAVFEAAMARVCLLELTPPQAREIDEWWRAAHADLAATAPPGVQCLDPTPEGWVQLPVLFTRPGSFQHSPYIWRRSAEMAHQPARLREALFGTAAGAAGTVDGFMAREPQAQTMWSCASLAPAVQSKAHILGGPDEGLQSLKSGQKKIETAQGASAADQVVAVTVRSLPGVVAKSAAASTRR